MIRRPARIPLAPLLGAIALLAVACGASAVTGLTLAKPQFLDHPDCDNINRRPLPVRTIELQFRDTRIQVSAEIASQAPQRTQGYMCRSTVPAGDGMLFERPAESTRGFWMYNTYVPLDILYLDPDGLTVDIASLAPCTRSDGESDGDWRVRCADESAPFAPSDYPYLNVLELPAGWLATQGITIEDAVETLRVKQR